MKLGNLHSINHIQPAKKTDDRKKQSIKSEPKVEKPKPKAKLIQQRWIIVPIVIVLIGAVLAGVFGLPKLFPALENTPEPTLTFAEDTMQEPALTTIATTVTAESSATPTKAVTPTATLLPTEITDDFGVEMVLVPAGDFIMGSKETEKTVYLDVFYIDKYEVTNSKFAECVKNSKCKPPSDFTVATNNYYGNPEFDNYPVVWVNIERAQNYCQWRGTRLPTEAEWEKAARGTDGRIYPWGNALEDLTIANFSGPDGYQVTSPVGIFLKDISPYGAYDMAGNVQEWTGDTYIDSSPFCESLGCTRPIVKGAHWSIYNEDTFIYGRGVFDENPRSYTGFRCAKDATP